MAISMLDNLSIKKQAPDVERQLFNNIAEMARFNERYLPDIYEANIKTDGSRWRFNRSNYIDPTTGKWRKIAEGGNGSSNYNELDNKPIINLTGTLGEPVIIENLEEGFYKIKGRYKISAFLTTTFSNIEGEFFIVDKSQQDKIIIKKISSTTIIDYEIIDENINSFSYMTEKNIEEYLNQYIAVQLDTKINEKFDEYIEATPQEDISNLFQ